RFTNGTLPGGSQPNVRGTTATPAAFDGREGRGLGPHEELLLLGGELHHMRGICAASQARGRLKAMRRNSWAVMHCISCGRAPRRSSLSRQPHLTPPCRRGISVSQLATRSEERRVGRECGSGWW